MASGWKRGSVPWSLAWRLQISLERIAKHCSNIAEEQMASGTDRHALHQYARDVKEGNGLYKELLEEYTEKYSLKKLEET